MKWVKVKVSDFFLFKIYLKVDLRLVVCEMRYMRCVKVDYVIVKKEIFSK